MSQDVAFLGSDGSPRFLSVAALREDHENLVRRRRIEGETAPFLDDVSSFVRDGSVAGVVIDTDDDRNSVQNLLDYWANILLRSGRTAPEATLANFDPQYAPSLPDELCPYRGLEPFGPSDADSFFGREPLIEQALKLASEHRLLAVVGPSGSGKSSLVLAGLLPRLKRGMLPDSENWRYLPPIVPGADPVRNLVGLYLSVQDTERTEVDREIALLMQDPAHLTEMLEQVQGVPFVISVDQFEEVFTLCHDEMARQMFVANLLGMTTSAKARHVVVLTLRTDFEWRIARFPALQDSMKLAEVRMTSLNAGELREAIELPADLVGLKFEEGLVNRLIEDVLGEPAALPLLQFALLKLWDNRERNRVTFASYVRLGSASAALALSANHLLESLIPEERTTLRRILLRLVSPTDGLEVTSMRVPLAELFRSGEAHDRIKRVLDKLVHARLVRLTQRANPDETQVEVAHEALIRNWPQLDSWITEERDDIRQRLRLKAAAEQWDATGQSDDALWRGTLLLQAESDVDLGNLERQFVEASQQAQNAEEAERESMRQRELTQALALVQAEQRRADLEALTARRLRGLTLALVFALALAMIFAIAAFNAASQARRQREDAVHARVAAEAGATQVAQNLTVAEGALVEQLGLIDQMATANAERAILLVQVQTAKATLSALGVPSEANTPTATATRHLGTLPTVTPIRTLTPIIVVTTLPSQMVTSTNAAVATPFRPSMVTATAAALATQRSQVQATQTAIAPSGGQTPPTSNWRKDFAAGTLAYNLKDWGNVIVSMTKVIEAIGDGVPERSQAFNLRGFAYFNIGNLEQSVEDYTKAITLNPDSAVAYDNRGVSYGLLGRFDDAVIDFTRAIDLGYEPPYQPYSNRAWNYYQMSMYEEALTDISKCLELDPQHTFCYFQRGLVNRAIGDRENARSDFSQCLVLDPNSATGAECRRQLEQIGQP